MNTEADQFVRELLMPEHLVERVKQKQSKETKE